MSAGAWIALSVGAMGFVLNVIALAVGYGVLKGTVTAIDGRVKAVEAEIGAINELKVAVVKIETKQDAMAESMRDLAASVRWMRSPAPARGKTAP